MKSYIRSLFILVFASALMAGCSGKKSNEFEGKSPEDVQKLFTHNQDLIRSGEGSEKEKAQSFADLGENALESPRGAHLAIVAFEEALKNDSENTKANFYSALLLPVLSLKGFPIRMTKIATPTAISEMIAEILSNIKDPNTRSLVSEFLNGASPTDVFKTPSEAQSYLVTKVLPAISESQKRLAKVLDNPHFSVTFNYDSWGRGRNWYGRRNSVTLDHAEAHSAELGLKGVATYVKILTAYNLDASMALRDEYYGREKTTFKEVAESLKKHPKFLTLNEGGAENLKSILTDGSDAIEGLKIIANMLNKSREGDRHDNILPPFRSKHQYADFMQGLVWATEVLAGPMEIPMEKNGKSKVILADFTAMLANPVQDLKSMLPTEFDETGKYGKTWTDLTFGGMVPNGDLLSSYCELYKDGEPSRIRLHLDLFGNHIFYTSFEAPVKCIQEQPKAEQEK
ncbi:MAG: hypothetical protein HYY62_09275 [Deltaproteobacteria bacterium]|nr:hypothetical protein [Deltaproteobacteria bacterium]